MTTELAGTARQAGPSGLPMLSLAALGVVFGDIGTSPLYAYREALRAATPAGQAAEAGQILGVLSLILWALILVVAVKYVLLLLRADNEGEGGTLSLLALCNRALPRPAPWLIPIGLIGAAMFFGDAVITPAISVLSAVEGLVVFEPGLKDWVMPIGLLVLLPLFILQSRGTGAVARLFGPVMLVWFVTIGLAGLIQAARVPAVFAGLSPVYALQFLASNGLTGLMVLGAAFLAVTGAEALYADMGHFGRKPIVRAWVFIAFPALLLNYFGQAAVVLTNPADSVNPFFRLFPEDYLLPVVFLSAAATVIASQAVISGAFSLARQAVQLRLLPRLRIRHTSTEQEGQIFVPVVNTLLLLGVTLLVLSFGSSERLAAAYGISVTGSMLVTTLLAFVVARHHWGWPWGLAILALGGFFILDLIFLAANLIKIRDGGWLPLMIAIALVSVMLSWRRGVRHLTEQDEKSMVPVSVLLRQMDSPSVAVIQGTGVYLTTSQTITPKALLHCLKHFRALHDQLIFVQVRTANQPVVAPSARLELEKVTARVTRITLFFGYMETPDVPKALIQHFRAERGFSMMTTSFILSRRRLRLAATGTIPRWQARLFLWCSRNAAGPTDYFRIPAGRVVEIGTQVNL